MTGTLALIRRRAQRAPASIACALLCVAAYAYTASAGETWWVFPAGDLLRLGGAYAPAIAAGEWWRLISAVILHGGLLHLVANLVALADIGPRVEAACARGAGRMLFIFFFCGAVGFLASIWWQPQALSIGASGGILGLYGFWFTRFRYGTDEVAAAVGSSSRQEAPVAVASEATPGAAAGPVAMPQRAALLALGLIIIAGFFIPGIDNAAHLGGLLAGVLLARFIALRSVRWRTLAFVALGSALFSGYYLLPAEWAKAYEQRKLFEQTYSAFAGADRVANGALKALLAEIAQGGNSGGTRGAQAAARIDRDVLPRLRDNRARWHELRLGEAVAAGMQGERDAWLRYSDLRVAAAEALREAFSARTQNEMQVALRRFDMATQAAREIADRARENVSE